VIATDHHETSNNLLVICSKIISISINMTDSLSVVLLISEGEGQVEKASEIQEILERDYFRYCGKDALCGRSVAVSVRSGQVPAERLLRTSSNSTATNSNSSNNKTLFVVLGPETAASMVLRSTTVHPVLLLSDVLVDHQQQSQAAAALAIAKFCTLHCAQHVATFVESAVQAQKQAALVHDAALKTAGYTDRIADCFDRNQQITGDRVMVATADRQRGKVRDRWEPKKQEDDDAAAAAATAASQKNTLALVTTDRQSGFDRQLAVVPYKGAVLNLCSQFWFDAVSDIIPNHLIATPHPSVSIARKCQPFPIEFVVRYDHIILID